MGSTYDKPHLTFGAQIDRLISRGMIVTDRSLAILHLQRIGYYHLSGYWYAFREMGERETRKDTFVPGTTFANVVDLYVFDKRLKMILMDAIERIEIAMRVQIAYRLGARDPFAQTRPDLLAPSFTEINPRTNRSDYQLWTVKVNRSIQRARDHASEQFVTHFANTYGFPLPIWVEAELWDFGDMSKLYAGMQVRDKRVIARSMGVADWRVFQSWLRTLTFVRNVSAHHGRLWNRNVVDQPRLPQKDRVDGFDIAAPEANTARLYPTLYLLAWLMKTLCPRSSWVDRLLQLIDTFPVAPAIGLEAMGFPREWQAHAIWKDRNGLKA